MASASKCDRCGKFYDNAEKAASMATYEYTVSIYGLFGPVLKDLCPNCRQQLNKWFADPSAGLYHRVDIEKITNDAVLCERPCSNKKRWWKK